MLHRKMKRALTTLTAGLAAATFSAAVSAQDDGIKVGFVYVSPIGDAGWTYQHDQGRKALEENLGDRVETQYVENVPEGADAERVIQQLASGGADLIFTTSFGYMNPTVKVAQRFPDTVFEHATGYKRAENVGTYMPRLYEGRYLAGMVAGAMTESDRLGFVAAFPIPEVIRAINAFTRGARASNPDATVRVIWINAWYDPSKARQAAETLMDQGADVVTHHTDSHAVVQAAAERENYAIAYHSDMAAYGDEYHLTSVAHHWGDFYTQRAEEVLNGEWTSRNVWGGIASGMVDIGDFSAEVPEAVREEVMAARQAMIDGELHPFAGPVIAKDGTEKVAEGETLSDEALLNMDYYVEGVASDLPED
ncbi:BMP family ABC transporter substrate-binding protein [Arhodomonas sp. SL1]|uniref:BMP family ABC transporter substrate-binding protein n=1 Tax=Arhodomonas sp. SL1 TaxID=3425691 RepID=UPI003F882F98